jgi:hypothetical protein
VVKECLVSIFLHNSPGQTRSPGRGGGLEEAGHCEGGAEGQEGGGGHFQAKMRDRGGARRGRLQDVLCLVPRHS